MVSMKCLRFVGHPKNGTVKDLVFPCKFAFSFSLVRDIILVDKVYLSSVDFISFTCDMFCSLMNKIKRIIE